MLAALTEARRGHPNPLRLKLETAVSHHMETGNGTNLGSLEEWPVSYSPFVYTFELRFSSELNRLQLAQSPSVSDRLPLRRNATGDMVQS